MNANFTLSGRGKPAPRSIRHSVNGGEWCVYVLVGEWFCDHATTGPTSPRFQLNTPHARASAAALASVPQVVIASASAPASASVLAVASAIVSAPVSAPTSASAFVSASGLMVNHEINARPQSSQSSAFSTSSSFIHFNQSSHPSEFCKSVQFSSFSQSSQSSEFSKSSQCSHFIQFRQPSEFCKSVQFS